MDACLYFYFNFIFFEKRTAKKSPNEWTRRSLAALHAHFSASKALLPAAAGSAAAPLLTPPRCRPSGRAPRLLPRGRCSSPTPCRWGTTPGGRRASLWELHIAAVNEQRTSARPAAPRLQLALNPGVHAGAVEAVQAAHHGHAARGVQKRQRLLRGASPGAGCESG